MIYPSRKKISRIGILFLAGWMLGCNLSAAAVTSPQATVHATDNSIGANPTAEPLVLPTDTVKAEPLRLPTGTPTATFTIAFTPTQTATLPIPTATFLPGAITGLVWHDINRNGKKDAGESGMAGMTVSLGQGACLSYGFMADSTTDAGTFYFSNVVPGVYCVRLVPDLPTRTITTLNPVTISLDSGKTITVNFGIF
jgi:hypothetical protein